MQLTEVLVDNEGTCPLERPAQVDGESGAVAVHGQSPVLSSRSRRSRLSTRRRSAPRQVCKLRFQLILVETEFLSFIGMQI